MNIPIYNCLIDENLDDATGVYAISFVDCPANEVDFVKLQRQQPEQLNRDTQKQILTGVVLQPDQLIYRNSPSMGEYYIKFSTEQIGKIAQKMMRSGLALHNTTHQHHQPLAGNYLVELWIVEDPQQDKSRVLGFANLPQGTLMCSYKIEDQTYWDEQVMTGHVKGFSLEGLFNQEIAMTKQINQSKPQKMNSRKKKQTLLKRITRLLLDIEDVKKKDTTDSGESYVLFILADGKEAYVDQDGFTTLDEEQMPAGEHQLANGNVLVVDDQGQIVETKSASGGLTKPKSASAPQTLRRKLSGQVPEETLPEEVDPKPATSGNTGEVLKQKIAEMQAAIDSLSKALEEAEAQVETLKKQTPSARPAVQRSISQDSKSLTTAERMAIALNQTIQRRR